MKKIVYIFLLLAIPLSLNAYAFTKTLSKGDVSTDVLELQKYLNSNSSTQVSTEGPGSPGNESSYFGEKTKQAVIKLQNLYASVILYPIGLVTGSGYVGPGTLNFLNINQNKSSINIPNTQSNLPVVESVTPEILSGKTKITITGSNFSENNTIIIGFESKNAYKNIESTDNGTKIEFDLESTIQKIFDEKHSKLSKKAKKKVLSQFPIIDIAVSVITDEGQSNFKIIKFKLK